MRRFLFAFAEVLGHKRKDRATTNTKPAKTKAQTGHEAANAIDEAGVCVAQSAKEVALV